MSGPASTRIPNRAFIAARRAKELGREALAARVRAWSYAEDSKHEPPALDTVVKCIGRVERGEVRSPGDFYTAAFSAVLEVPAAELFGSQAPAASPSAALAVTSHQFVPLYVGAAAVHELAGQARFDRVDLGWTHAHAAPVDHPAAIGTAYLLDWGVVLLHLAQPLAVPGVADLAVWRNRQHAGALGGDTLHPYLSAAIGRPAPAPDYVLSAYWVDEAAWTGETLATAVRLMCVPSTLLDRLQDDDAVLLVRAEVAERAHLRSGFTHPDITEFGVPGVALGCASWSGVVYAPLAPSRALHPHELVNLEVVAQSLWCYTAHLLDAATRGEDLTLSPRYGWRFLRTWRARLLTARPTETGQVRMMRDAVLATCGLLDRLDEAQASCATPTDGRLETSVDPDRTALVVVDVQNGFITDLSRPVIPAIADLVTRWTAAGRPLVFTRYLNHAGSMFEKLLDWRKVAHSPETDIVPELADAATRAHVVDKHGYTLFNDTGRALISDQGWTDLVFCGIDTEICVLKSAVDAFEAGVTPWVVTDASASHSSQAAHDAGILIGRRFIGPAQFITTNDVLS